MKWSLLMPPPRSSWQLLIYFQSLWTCLLWTFHINQITQFVTCVCYFSLSTIHTVACVSAPSFVMAEEYSTIRRHHTLLSVPPPADGFGSSRPFQPFYD